jgi:predicted aminopeptidase
MIFHELAHQIVYVQGDSQFNESFASAVEEAGVERWLERFGNQAMREAMPATRAASTISWRCCSSTARPSSRTTPWSTAATTKSARSRRACSCQLKDEYQVLKANWGGYAGYDRFFAEPLSNAHLASIATYKDFVPAFRAMLRREKKLPAFLQVGEAAGRAGPQGTSPHPEGAGAADAGRAVMVQRSKRRPSRT